MTPGQRREQLLDVVLDIINTDGVAAVSMDGVARRAGVTRPVVYSLFTDTNDLLRGSLDREEQRALAQITDAVATSAADDLVTSFERIFDAYLAAVAEAPDRWRAIHSITDSSTPAFHKRVERARTALARQFENALRDSGELDATTDFELLARHILAATWDSGRLLLTEPDDYRHDRLLSGLVGLITALVTTPTNGRGRQDSTPGESPTTTSTG
ncbi:TetR/AcrR family transcriptional regulator [Mycobacterium paragordonae]